MNLILSLVIAVAFVFMGWEFGQALKAEVGSNWAIIILVPLFLLIHTIGRARR